MKTFFRNLITLMTGTILGQLIIIITMPLITRIYNPEQFGEYSSILAIIGILSVITTLRYDIALAITNDIKTRQGLYHLSTILNILVSFVIIIVLIFLNYLFDYFGLREIVFIGLSIILIGQVQIFSNLSVSKGFFKEVSFTKFTQSLSQVIIQLFGYFFKNNTIFLFLGYLVGKSFGLIYLYKKNSVNNPNQRTQLVEYRRLIKEFKNYPLFVLPSSIVNATASNFLLILILFFYGGFFAGIYAFILRMINAPLQMISKSYNSSLYKFSQDNKLKDLRKLYFYTSGTIIFLFIVIILVYQSIEFNIFSTFFGSEWGYVENVFTPLLYMTALQFSVIPVSEILTIINKQKLRLIWDTLRMLAILSIFIAVYIMAIEFIDFISIYALTMMIFYFVMHMIIIVKLNEKIKEIKKE